LRGCHRSVPEKRGQKGGRWDPAFPSPPRKAKKGTKKENIILVETEGPSNCKVLEKRAKRGRRRPACFNLRTPGGGSAGWEQNQRKKNKGLDGECAPRNRRSEPRGGGKGGPVLEKMGKPKLRICPKTVGKSKARARLKKKGFCVWGKGRPRFPDHESPGGG